MEPDHPGGGIGLVVTGLVVTGFRASSLGVVTGRMTALSHWVGSSTFPMITLLESAPPTGPNNLRQSG